MSLRFLAFAFIAVVLRNVAAITDEQKAQIQAKFLQVGADCLKTNPLSLDDIKSFKEKKFPESDKAPCFTACVLKNVGIFDEKGQVSKSDAIESAKKIFEDEEELKNIEELLNACSSVNDEDVGDDESGCDRAKLAYPCLIENAEKFGFGIDF